MPLVDAVHKDLERSQFAIGVDAVAAFAAVVAEAEPLAYSGHGQVGHAASDADVIEPDVVSIESDSFQAFLAVDLLDRTTSVAFSFWVQ